jgi:predicted permease
VAVLLSILPIFAVIGLGAALRGGKFLSEASDATLLRLSVNVLYPCLLFDAILANPALTSGSTVWTAPALGFALASGGILLSLLAAPLAGLAPGPSRRTFALASGMFNWAYLPLPIVLAQFGRETVGVLAVFSLGVEVAMWTTGLLVLTGAGDGRGLRRVVNGPVLGILASLAANLFQGGTWFPVPAREAVHLVGQASIPIGLMLIGASFFDFFGHVAWRSNGRALAAACLLRLGLLPLAFVATAAWLPVSDDLRRVIAVQAAMPAAVFPLVMARIYGGNAPLALLVILGTTLASLATMPLWIAAGLRWLGL